MAGKLNRVLEGYRPIPMKRLFYPRGMKLSENFINAFHQEYDRLVGEGINPRSLLERFSKALKFHVTEKRRYTDPVVEAGTAPWSPAPEDSTKRRDRQKLETKEKDDKAASKKRGDKKPSKRDIENIDKWSKDQS